MKEESVTVSDAKPFNKWCVKGPPTMLVVVVALRWSIFGMTTPLSSLFPLTVWIFNSNKVIEFSLIMFFDIDSDNGFVAEALNKQVLSQKPPQVSSVLVGRTLLCN
jgi:hypothetical protein